MLRDLFADTYFLVPLLSFIGGLFAAYHWHLLHTNIGKALIAFSIGQLMQTLGQVTYSIYYVVLGVENPYFTLGDIFYLSSLIFFILGFIFLYKGMGITLHMVSKHCMQIITGIILFLVIVKIALPVGFLIFSDELVMAYISIGIILVCLVSFLLVSTWYVLAGAFRQSFILIFLSFIVLLVADAVYLNETYTGSWQAGGISDTFYLISYFLLGLGLTTLGNKFYKPQTEPISVFFSYESLID